MHIKHNAPRITDALKQLHIHIGPRSGWHAIDGDNFLTPRQSRLTGLRTVIDFSQTGRQTGHTHTVQQPISHDGKQEIGDRTRYRNRHTLPHGLAIERQVKLVIWNKPFSFIQHFDVTTERDSGNCELGSFKRDIATCCDNLVRRWGR